MLKIILHQEIVKLNTNYEWLLQSSIEQSRFIKKLPPSLVFKMKWNPIQRGLIVGKIPVKEHKKRNFRENSESKLIL